MNTVLFVNATIGYSENLFSSFYSCGLSTVTIEYSCLSVCVMFVCVALSDQLSDQALNFFSI